MACLGVGGVALGADPSVLPWDQSNITTLRSLDTAAIFELIGGGAPDSGFTENNILEFGWYDLAKDGKYELAFTGSFGPCCVFLTILSKDSAGKLTEQSFDGAGKLSETIRDLNGDGRDELIISTLVVENTGRSGFYWPAVYRQESGKYVEASRDFPAFYDNEVLPQIVKQSASITERIRKHHADTATAAQDDTLAGLTMERDKILRVLGRDPTAGLQDAYQWMNSDDPDLLQDAAVTFKEIGGHEQQAHAALAASTRAFCRQHPTMSICMKGGPPKPTL